MKTTDKTRALLEALGAKGFDYEIASEYGEPGYSTDKPIIFGNWNDLEQELINELEEAFEMEWSDEWVILYEEDCKAYRVKPDSYGWQPSIVLNDCAWVSFDWLVESGELQGYIERELCGNYKAALNTPCIDESHLKPFASLLEDGFESGLHAHMTDDPKAILESLPEEKRGRVFFRIDSTSQFSIGFQVWEMNQ